MKDLSREDVDAKKAIFKRDLDQVRVDDDDVEMDEA
jgi:hypothetical protein